VHLSDGALVLTGSMDAGEKGGVEKTHDCHALIERCLLDGHGHLGTRRAVEDVVHAAVALVLGKELEEEREVLRDVRVLDVLGDELLIGMKANLLVGHEHARKVLPTAGGDQTRAVHDLAYMVEALGLALEVGDDGRVHLVRHRVVTPDVEVGLHVDALHAVERGGIEVTGGTVVLGRVASRDDGPSRRQTMLAERLELQELEHGRGERLGYAVDLVEEEYALLDARLLDDIIDRCDDLAHRVAAHTIGLVTVLRLLDVREADGALTRMVRHRVRDEVDAHAIGDLLNDGGLAHTGRAHEEHGPLHLGRNEVDAQIVLGHVCTNRAFDLFGCLLDIHRPFLP